jgi:hypothetical protein
MEIRWMLSIVSVRQVFRPCGCQATNLRLPYLSSRKISGIVENGSWLPHCNNIGGNRTYCDCYRKSVDRTDAAARPFRRVLVGIGAVAAAASKRLLGRKQHVHIVR